MYVDVEFVKDKSNLASGWVIKDGALTYFDVVKFFCSVKDLFPVILIVIKFPIHGCMPWYMCMDFMHGCIGALDYGTDCVRGRGKLG